MSNPWEDWLGAIDPEDLKRAKLPERIKRMRREHGQAPEGEQCKGCPFLRHTNGYNRRYWKCTKYRLSHGAATDWRVSWPACGLKPQKDQQETTQC